MQILIRSARIFDKESEFNGLTKDIVVEDGVIKEIGDALIAPNAKEYQAEGLCVSIGWLDMRVGSRDPGLEHKEDLQTVRLVAERGGFTEILLMPNTEPVVQSKDTIRYIQAAGDNGVVKLHVAGAVTRKTDGVDFTEMMDLHQAGVSAFTDGSKTLQNADILLKSILYLLPLDTLLINKPEDGQLALFGQMHEGVTSTLIGMKGIPSLAEEMMVIRDLKLLAYALEGRPERPTNPLLHISLLSTAEAVEHVRKAKENGLPVSCDVAAHQLAFLDEDLMSFDTNLKVSPPFRSQRDREAIKRGLVDGTIDAIVSDHSPQDEESKNLEFDHAEVGMLGLETCFSTAIAHSGLDVETVVDKLSRSPRQILRMPVPKIAVGERANFTFFNPEDSWTYSRTLSKSKNSPFLGQALQGKVLGVMNRGEIRWF
ncbi:dihydroorotase [Dyadobacter jejuensis]|uniref:Dihydroorotase n=1 Tax=Dyadobacter jejuensis TaxID=1082580 RepID=A0A316AQP8_9BACT|nr:dihydroorotase [Dyadobacter jejuensis]PWJ59619.1 dihydroorotase [Dyadobacter jejuensis]